MVEQYNVKLLDRDVVITVKRKKTSKVRIVISKDNKITFICSPFISKDDICKYIKKNEDWLIKHLTINKTNIDKYEIDKCLKKEKIWFLGKLYNLVRTDNKEKHFKYDEDNYYIPKNLNDGLIFEKIYEKNQHILIKQFNNALLRMEKIIDGTPNLSFRSMRSRWGTCQYKLGKVIINKKCIFVSIQAIEMVMYHELCHFLEPNHSKKFYEALSIYVPNHKKIKKELNNMSFVLKLDA